MINLVFSDLFLTYQLCNSTFLSIILTLTGGAGYKELDLDTPLDKMDVSLISGRVRKLGLAENESNASGSSTVAIRDSMTLAAVTGMFQSHRNFKAPLFFNKLYFPS